METTPAAPEKPVDLPEQGPQAFAEACPELAEDTMASLVLSWLNTLESEDSLPDGPDSPSLAAFLHELPDLSEYVAEGGCPKEPAAAAGLGDGEVSVDDVDDFTSFLSRVPDFSEYVAEGGCPHQQVVAAGLGDSEDTIPNGLPFPNSLISADFLDDLHDFSMYAADGACPRDHAVVAGLGDSEDTTLTTSVPNVTAEALDEHPDLCGYVAEGCLPQGATGGGGAGGWRGHHPQCPRLDNFP